MSGREGMTPWRARILTLAAQGCTNQEIGALFGHTGNAINLHMQAIYRVLGARNRAHAVALGIRHGHVDPAAVEPEPRTTGAAA